MTKKLKPGDLVREDRVTYDLYASMDDDGKRYEVLEGKLELMAGPLAPHQVAGAELSHILHQSCRSDYIIFTAPFDVILSPTNVLQPDIMMVHRSRIDIVNKRGIFGAPDLVVEVLSPGSLRRDRVRKANIYARYGVPEYWIIDAWMKTLERHVLVEGRYDLADVFEEDQRVLSDRLSCVSFAISELFSDPNFDQLLN